MLLMAALHPFLASILAFALILIGASASITKATRKDQEDVFSVMKEFAETQNILLLTGHSNNHAEINEQFVNSKVPNIGIQTLSQEIIMWICDNNHVIALDSKASHALAAILLLKNKATAEAPDERSIYCAVHSPDVKKHVESSIAKVEDAGFQKLFALKNSSVDDIDFKVCVLSLLVYQQVITHNRKIDFKWCMSFLKRKNPAYDTLEEEMRIGTLGFVFGGYECGLWRQASFNILKPASLFENCVKMTVDKKKVEFSQQTEDRSTVSGRTTEKKSNKNVFDNRSMPSDKKNEYFQNPTQPYFIQPQTESQLIYEDDCQVYYDSAQFESGDKKQNVKNFFLQGKSGELDNQQHSSWWFAQKNQQKQQEGIVAEADDQAYIQPPYKTKIQKVEKLETVSESSLANKSNSEIIYLYYKAYIAQNYDAIRTIARKATSPVASFGVLLIDPQVEEVYCEIYEVYRGMFESVHQLWLNMECEFHGDYQYEIFMAKRFQKYSTYADIDEYY